MLMTRRSGSVVVAQSGAPVPLTGSTVETTLATITIPGGLMGPNGSVEIIPLFSHTNNANLKTIRVKFGGTAYAALAASTTTNTQSLVRITNANSVSAQKGFGNPLAGFGTTAGVLVTSAVDTNAAVTVLITGQLAVGTDTLTLENYTVKAFRA